MISITQSIVVAETETDLRNAVSSNNDVDYVYLANHITLTAGITIYAGKTSLTIDGEYPAGSGIFHEFTDMDSIFSADTIGISSASSMTLTFRNMMINGRNHYGVPCIYELVNTSNLSVIYENVTYTGPQITYNHNGLTRYIDCNITIRQTGTAASGEVGEVNRVEIGGVTNITHLDTDDSVFYFRGAAGTMSLTVLANANVSITSEYSYFMFNMLAVIGTAYPVPYVIQTGASLNLTVNRGISYDYRNQIASFLIDTNASFRYIQTASNSASASFYINGALTVRQGARFYMQAQSGTQPLIYFSSGTQRSLNIDNPLSFVLYNPNVTALYSAGTTQFSLHGGQLNTWNPATVPVGSAGGFDDTPDFKWFKRNYATTLEVTGSFTALATTASSNLISPDDNPYPAITNLHLHESRVLSIGDWTIMVNPVTDDGSPITGWTEPNANLRIEYTPEGDVSHLISGTAEGNGRFSVDTSGQIPPAIAVGTEVAVSANIPFLIKRVTVIVIEAGDLLITSAPTLIEFRTRPISTNPVLLPRMDPRVPVTVEDTRGAASTQWKLLASITGPLQTADGHILPNAVVFLEMAGSAPVILRSEPTEVFTGGPFVETTSVFWEEPVGILIQVTEPMRAGVVYSTYVTWDLEIIEDP